jgi:hypothetical protein
MKRSILAFLVLAFVCAMATNAYAGPNHNAKFALHLAGPHDAKANTCDYVMTNCNDAVTSVVNPGAGDYDIYVIAVDVNGLAGARYGLYCETALGAPMYFAGWLGCSDFEVPSAGWPSCGAGNSEAFTIEQTNVNVTLGILEVYIYPGTNAKLCTTKDPRVGYAEVCDGTEPIPQCDKVTLAPAFGCVGFNRLGYNPCFVFPVEQRSWGAVKSLYR